MTTVGNNYCVVENECWGAKNLKFEITRYVCQNNIRNKSNTNRLNLASSDTALLELLKNYAKLELEPIKEQTQDIIDLDTIKDITVKQKKQHLFKSKCQEDKQNLQLDLSSESISQKSVRFADKFGLKLSNVKTFTPSPDSPVPPSPVTPSPPLTPTATLVPMFAQPGCSPDFLHLVRQQNLLLEFASMCGDTSVNGMLWVTNIHFIKNVVVRWTKDSWGTIREEEAQYVKDDNTEVDRFKFTVQVGEVTIGTRVELCFRYESGGCRYWDNNNGKNYVFQVFMSKGARDIGC